FTVSLFITGLSFPGNEQLVADAKVGVLGASVLAAVLGSVVLLLSTRSRVAAEPGEAGEAEELDH
ncbi:MAG TPA: Na+/H+ antiporter NhaA, partial [Nocardioidaceae bacterium]|nr:Na+/H+ antiporter NhaA [Nocardioidaceae bacterium]